LVAGATSTIGALAKAVVKLFQGIGSVSYACLANRGNWPLLIVAGACVSLLVVATEMTASIKARQARPRQAAA